MSRIPLAWKNLVHDKRRLLIAVGGIVFAVLLMFTQTGFRNGLFDSTIAILKKLDGDIVLYSRAKFSLVSYQRFDARLLELARATGGVRSVEPIYTENPLATIRRIQHGESSQARPIRVIGIDINGGLMKTVSDADLHSLARPDSALMDVRSKQEYGFEVGDVALLARQQAELSGKALRLVGTFEMGTDFANDGNLLMSSDNFAKYFPQRNPGGDPLDVVDIGIVRIAESANRDRVIEQLKIAMPDTIRVVSMDQYQSDEVRFWSTATPIGTIFLIGTIMGFVVGIIICYQVLATDIADHISEFATLRAMGYPNRYFLSLILAESLYLSIFGFVPGLLLSMVIFQVMSGVTGLIMTLTIGRVLLVYVLTLTMCVASGMIAVRKLVAADPASLF